jgi:hypothetical protein
MPKSPLYLPTIAPSTTAHAIDAMIVAGGEGPIAGSVVHRPDREAAASLLDEALRECLTEGWTFNTEHGLEIGSDASISWLGSDGTAEVLNIFEPPQNLLSFKVTQSVEQGDLDFIVRPPRDWLGGPLVFYDRVLNRDGYADRTSLYIDPTWLMDYEDIPQTARNVVFLRALRRFLTQIVGDFGAADRKERDELLAFRNLKKEFGAEDRYNLFGNRTTARHFGFRFFDQSTVDDRRGNRSGAVGGAGYRVATSIDLDPLAFTLDAFETEEPLAAPAQIMLRRSVLSLSTNDPNSPDVASITIDPQMFTLDATVIPETPESITLGLTSVNLVAPTSPANVVASITMDPQMFPLDATVVPPNPAALTLLSNTVAMTFSPPGYSMSAVLSTNATINPGTSVTGTVTITRVGGFAGAVSLSSVDTRISFPSGPTINVGQTSVPFLYTVPSNSGVGLTQVQFVGTASEQLPQVANFSATIGFPGIDFTVAAFLNVEKGFATTSLVQAVRTNYVGPVTFVGSLAMQPPFSFRVATAQPYLDFLGTGVSAPENSAAVFGTSISTGEVRVTVPTSYTGGSFNFNITASIPGGYSVTKTFAVTVVTSGGGGGTNPNAVASITMEPLTFSLDATTSQSQPSSMTLGASSVSLTL